MERTKRRGVTVEQQLNREGHWPPPNLLLLHPQGIREKVFSLRATSSVGVIVNGIRFILSMFAVEIGKGCCWWLVT